MKRMIATLLLAAASTAAAQDAKPVPMCIVDGVRVPAETCFGTASLVKSRIESVEVLKGNAAIAQYGADAVNGVVTITTKDGSRPGADPLAKLLYPPELVMANKGAISLTEKQTLAVQGYALEAQVKFVTSQLKLGGEVEKLAALLKAPSTDEEKAVEQVNRVLDLERDIKQAQVRMMVRVKNVLTAAQQAELNKMRDKD